jgi:protein-S-isoprenylcysteine O-methyltransferase Ste14
MRRHPPRSTLLVRCAGLLLIAVLAARLLRPWIAKYVGKLSPSYWPLWVTTGVWAVFSIFWESAAQAAPPAAISEAPGSRKLHLFLVNSALFLILAPIPGLRQQYLPASAIVTAAGLTIQLAGLLLAVWARCHLGRYWSGEIAIKLDHALVRSGPYALVRHPIYTALLAMYAGSAVVSGEWHAFVGLTLAVLAYARKVRLEEASLVKSFGAAYREYRSATWAVLPWLF